MLKIDDLIYFLIYLYTILKMVWIELKRPVTFGIGLFLLNLSYRKSHLGNPSYIDRRKAA
jgi:hypothetical protein